MDFVYAPLAYYKQGPQARRERGHRGRISRSLNYDELNVEEVGKELEGLSAQELREVREYEKGNKNRETVINQIDRKLKPAS